MTLHPKDTMPEWLVRGAGSYPVAEALSISEVERILEVSGWVEYRCDEVAVPEGAVQ